MCCLSLAGADPAAQQLLIAAERHAQVLAPNQGHVTYRWEASDRYWGRFSMEDFQEINGERLYTLRNATFTPLRIGELNSLVHRAVNTDHLEVRKQKTTRGAGAGNLLPGSSQRRASGGS